MPPVSQFGRGVNALLYVAIICYLGSMFLPGVVYKASVYGNDKYVNSPCPALMGALAEGRTCQVTPEQFISQTGAGWDIRCNLPPDQATNPDLIRQQCVGYDTPLVSSDRGYNLLLEGIFGMLLGIFSWFSNVLILLALLFACQKQFKPGMVFSSLAILLALQSYAFHEKPLDEGVVKSLTVDHLGSGFYFWILSFILLLLYCVLKPKHEKASGKERER
jgi:hypothetical protein